MILLLQPDCKKRRGGAVKINQSALFGNVSCTPAQIYIATRLIVHFLKKFILHQNSLMTDHLRQANENILGLYGGIKDYKDDMNHISS